MAQQWYAPLDPDCEVANKYFSDLMEDPMTEAMGAPVDDIMDGFERKHRATCTRCQEYGAANIDVR